MSEELTLVSSTLAILPDAQLRQMTVAEAVDRFISMRIAEGIVKPHSDHHRHYDKQLRRSFCNALGTMPLAAVRADHIRHWLANLTHNRYGKVLAPVTRRHYLKGCKTFLKRAVAEGWIDKDPSAPIVSPKVPDKDVNTIAPEAAFRFFQTNVLHPAVPRIALEAFGGLRFSTAARLQKDALNFEQKGITMEASIHKSGRRHYREGHPACLWEWLKLATDETWAMDWRAYRDAKQAMHFYAGLRRELNRYQVFDEAERKRQAALKNCWRHTFATMLLAQEGSFAKAAYLMQHTRHVTTVAHYEGRATKADAALYFAITPAACRTMTWQQFRNFVLKPEPVLEPESVPRYYGEDVRAG